MKKLIAFLLLLTASPALAQIVDDMGMAFEPPLTADTVQECSTDNGGCVSNPQDAKDDNYRYALEWCAKKLIGEKSISEKFKKMGSSQLASFIKKDTWVYKEEEHFDTNKQPYTVWCGQGIATVNMPLLKQYLHEQGLLK